MDAPSIITTLALTLGVGWCSGLNLYATVAVLGAMHRFADGFSLPVGMEGMGHWAVIAVASFMYTIEFVADKIPAVDSVWDSVHTFIRIPAGAAMAGMAVGDVPIELQLVAGLLGGTLALGSHTTKAVMRLAAHGTGTSPILSPTISLGEDIAVIGMLGLIVSHPVLAIFLLAMMMIAAFFVLRAFWGLAKQVLRFFRRKSGVYEKPNVVETPVQITQ